MKSRINFVVLPILLILATLTSVNLSNIDSVFAQNDNVLGQDGEGDNEASQSDNNSQETNQNSMCVSGESTSLSCNNLSSENIGSERGEEGPQGPEGSPGPQSIAGKIYEVRGPIESAIGPTPVSSTAKCNSGDSLVSGGIDADTTLTDAPLTFTQSSGNTELNQWTVQAATSEENEIIVQAFAYCFDNP